MKKKNKTNLIFEPKKKLGQNFIFDEKLLKKIIGHLEIEKKTNIIEIGTGYANMTKLLSETECEKIISIEKDEKLYELVNNIKNEKIIFINGDIINIDIKKLEKEKKKLIITGNLPYYLSKRIIIKIIQENINFEKLVFLIQEEVGKKISENNKKNNAFSAFLKTFCEIKLLMKIKKESFIPIPKVNGILIKIKETKKNNSINLDRKKYFLFLKELFSKKRKTIYNNLIDKKKNQIEKTNIEDLLNKLKIKKNSRSETLEIEKCIKLYDSLN